MSSKPGSVPVCQESDLASHRQVAGWAWPPAARGVLAVLVIAAAMGLTFGSRSVPEPGAKLVKIPDLLIDVNTVPPSVLETLPHVGPALVRQLVAARERRPIISLEDAGSRVRGLGPVTLAQIAPYLRFESTASLRVGGLEGEPGDQPVMPARTTRSKKTRPPKSKSVALEAQLVSRSSNAAAL